MRASAPEGSFFKPTHYRSVSLYVSKVHGSHRPRHLRFADLLLPPPTRYSFTRGLSRVRILGAPSLARFCVCPRGGIATQTLPTKGTPHVFYARFCRQSRYRLHAARKSRLSPSAGVQRQGTY